MKTLFEQDEDYKKIIVGNLWKNKYIKYETKGDRNKTYQ